MTTHFLSNNNQSLENSYYTLSTVLSSFCISVFQFLQQCYVEVTVIIIYDEETETQGG